MSQFAELLQRQFDPNRAGELDITLSFRWPEGECRVGVHDGILVVHNDPQAAPHADLVLYFRDERLARDILSGRSNPVQAFMQGDFRSNGYIVWTFQTLAAFSNTG